MLMRRAIQAFLCEILKNEIDSVHPTGIGMSYTSPCITVYCIKDNKRYQILCRLGIRKLLSYRFKIALEIG